jgi:hypothetical protein
LHGCSAIFPVAPNFLPTTRQPRWTTITKAHTSDYGQVARFHITERLDSILVAISSTPQAAKCFAKCRTMSFQRCRYRMASDKLGITQVAVDVQAIETPAPVEPIEPDKSGDAVSGSPWKRNRNK